MEPEVGEECRSEEKDNDDDVYEYDDGIKWPYV